MQPRRHPTVSLTYEERASLPNNSPVAAFLLRLISIKHTNLCVSADVTSTAELLQLAEEVGDSICVLKTHADIVQDFGDRTIQGLRDVAKRRKFLVFEDRKFGDIGSTVQKQYAAGPLGIVKWAAITNAHIFPGPAIVIALEQAAKSAIAAYNTRVETEISAGTPPPSSASESDDEDSRPDASHADDDPTAWPAELQGRKPSVVSVSTTISTKTEAISPQPTPRSPELGAESMEAALERLGPPPFLRALLLLAEMSSEGNLLTGAYTEQCVAIARQHRDFVMGFVAQRSLNVEKGDNFVTMTPGVNLPPPGQEGKKMGDALGQQYNTPRKVVLEMGCDVIIVGRGILNAPDRRRAAERYRKEGWAAYEERIRAKR
ncbi:Orotidine 5'-phosphate decarboxylase domain-containing protein [Cryomyces antarcticus]